MTANICFNSFLDSIAILIRNSASFYWEDPNISVNILWIITLTLNYEFLCFSISPSPNSLLINLDWSSYDFLSFYVNSDKIFDTNSEFVPADTPLRTVINRVLISLWLLELLSIKWLIKSIMCYLFIHERLHLKITFRKWRALVKSFWMILEKSVALKKVVLGLLYGPYSLGIL
jgi:hypothetical protein